jgi:hypothetical protein
MAQYMLLLKGADFSDLSPEDAQGVIGKYMAWSRQIRDQGHYVAGDELADPVTVIEGYGDAARAVDGPFTETKEMIGGYFIIQAKDLDEAVKVAGGCPHQRYKGTIELREIILR